MVEVVQVSISSADSRGLKYSSTHWAAVAPLLTFGSPPSLMIKAPISDGGILLMIVRSRPKSIRSSPSIFVMMKCIYCQRELHLNPLRSQMVLVCLSPGGWINVSHDLDGTFNSPSCDSHWEDLRILVRTLGCVRRLGPARC